MAKIRYYWKRAGFAQKVALSLPVLLVALGIGGFGYVVVANYSAEQKWEEEKARLEAAGVTLNFKELLSPSVPDDENFCAIPALRGLRLEENADKRERLEMLIDWNSGAEYEMKNGGLHNLERSRLGETLAFLEGSEPGSNDSLPLEEAGTRLLQKIHEADVDGVFAELASAVGRSESQFVPGWEKTAETQMRLGASVPHLASVQGLAITNGHRAVAAGYAGEDEVFAEVIEIQLQIVRALLKEPVLVAELLAITNLVVTINSIWERLALGQVDEATLLDLEDSLAKVNLQDGFASAIHAELTHMRDAMLPILDEPEKSGLFEDPSIDLVLAILLQQKVKGNVQYDLCQIYYEGVAVPTRAGWPTLAKAIPVLEEKLKKSPKGKSFGNLVISSAEVFGTVANNTITAESMLRRARIAIALERYSNVAGNYPESLDLLVPNYLEKVQNDPVTGGHTKYGKDETNGRYVLWHTGLDAEDDGGKIIPEPVEGEDLPKFNRRDYEGDWIWKYPAIN